MRWMLLALGVAFGIGATAVTTLHGWHLGSTPESGAIFALFFCAVSVFALTGPMVAGIILRQAKGARKLWALVYGILAVMAFAGNAINSLDAIVTRFDKTVAGRQGESSSRKDTRSEMERALAERKALPAFAPTTREVADAARDALASAERSRKAECEKRGNVYVCQLRESAEARARADLAKALQDAATTARADDLDRRIATLRERLGSAPAPTAIDPLANAAARFLQIAEADAATLRWFYMSLLIEVAVALFLFGFELIEPRAKAQAAEPPAETPAPAPMVEKKEPVRPAPAIEAKPTPRQKLPAAASDTVGRFMLACLPKAEGAEVSWGDIYKAYLAHCEKAGSQPLAPQAFGERLNDLCRKARIQTESRDGKAFCVNVKLVA